jgi:predicted dehydrogenase
MTSQCRVLVVGCGWVSRQVHLPYLARLHQTGKLAALHSAVSLIELSRDTHLYQWTTKAEIPLTGLNP